MEQLTKLIESNPVNQEFTFAPEFNEIIKSHVQNYDNFAGEDKASLRSFLEDMQKGGCQSGMIGEFIYHADNKDFYIKHIEDLEEYKQELEDSIGEAIANRQNLVHYTFIVWLCFEEYCYTLYNAIFEQ